MWAWRVCVGIFVVITCTVRYGFAVRRRAAVMGRDEKVFAPHSSARDSAVHKPVSSFKRPLQGLPHVGRRGNNFRCTMTR